MKYFQQADKNKLTLPYLSATAQVGKSHLKPGANYLSAIARGITQTSDTFLEFSAHKLHDQPELSPQLI